MSMNQELVNILNKVIREAIMHGGDSGGAYFSNNKGLMESVEDLLVILSLDDDFQLSEVDRYGDYSSEHDAIVLKTSLQNND